MTGIALEAPAKVNLFLRVLGRDASGYHAIETLFAALDLHDTLRVRRTDSAEVELTVEGPYDPGPPEDNLAVRAAEAYLERTGGRGAPGVEIVLRKAIPPGAGLGGGSSDAAAVLRALDRLHGGPLGPEGLVRAAGELGSDVPFFLASAPLALAWSRGDRLLSLPPLPGRPVVVVLPSFRISTPEAYAALDRRRTADGAGEGTGPGAGGPDRGRSRMLELGALSSWERVTTLAGNDFHAVVAERHPVIDELRGALEAEGARPCLLAGSGSALFGVFDDPELAEAAGRRLAAAFPDAGVRTSRTLSRWPAPRRA